MSTASRRTFLKTSAAFTAAASMNADRLSGRPVKQPLGLQLYSVRAQLPTDFEGTLAKLGAAGYKVVEAAGYYNRSAADFRRAMDNAGLRCVSTHLTLSLLETQLDSILEYSHALGLEYIVCSSSGGMHRNPAQKGPPTLDDWRWIAGEFNKIGEKIKAAGITFGVHNHTPEFAMFDGTCVYDELLRLTDPKLVIFEMDAGWVFAARRNPVDYLTKTPERFPLMHIKDMILKDDNSRPHMTVLGKGTEDYRPILKAAKDLKYYFIEQEEFDIEPFEELRQDAEYMRKLEI
jgi:sugar phosphate isomerase/epimerase